MKTADYGDRQGSPRLSTSACGAAEDALQVLAGEALLLHPEFDRLDPIRRIHRVVLVLIGVDQDSEYLEPIPFRRARARTSQPFDLRKGHLVIRFVADWLDFIQDRAP